MNPIECSLQGQNTEYFCDRMMQMPDSRRSAYELGIATRERYDWWVEKKENIARIIGFCEKNTVKPNDINGYLESIGSSPLHSTVKVVDLIARPGISIEELAKQIPKLKEILEASKNRKHEISEAAEIKMKYKGYIERERTLRRENASSGGHQNKRSLRL